MPDEYDDEDTLFRGLPFRRGRKSEPGHHLPEPPRPRKNPPPPAPRRQGRTQNGPTASPATTKAPATPAPRRRAPSPAVSSGLTATPRPRPAAQPRRRPSGAAPALAPAGGAIRRPPQPPDWSTSQAGPDDLSHHMPPDYEDTVHWFTAGLHRQPWAATFALAGGYTPVVLSMWAALFGLLAGAFAGAGLVATNKFTHTIGAGASGVGLVFAGIASGVVTALAAFGAVYTALFVRDPLQTILALILGGLITLGIVASIVRYEGDLLLVRGYRRPSRDEARLLAPAVQSVGAGLRLSSFPRFCVWDSAAMGAWTHMRHIVISTGLLQTLEPAELEAVIAHEMHHWRNGDSVALRVVWAAGLPISVLYNIGCLLAGKSKAQTLRVS